MPPLPAAELTAAIKNSPIHSRIDIGAILDQAGVPHPLRPLIHELLIVRGKYPPAISPEESILYSQEAVDLPFDYRISLDDFDYVNTVVGLIIGAWRQQLPSEK